MQQNFERERIVIRSYRQTQPDPHSDLVKTQLHVPWVECPLKWQWSLLWSGPRILVGKFSDHRKSRMMERFPFLFTVSIAHCLWCLRNCEESLAGQTSNRSLWFPHKLEKVKSWIFRKSIDKLSFLWLILLKNKLSKKMTKLWRMDFTLLKNKTHNLEVNIYKTLTSLWNCKLSL